MADYKELLRRAISALPENNGAARRAVYEKARSALVGQLRAIDPPLAARDITQHRLQLEDCIRQVEQEASEAIISLARDNSLSGQSYVPPSRPAAVPPRQAEPAPVGVAELPPKPAMAPPVTPVASPVSIEDIISQAAANSGTMVEAVAEPIAPPQAFFQPRRGSSEAPLQATQAGRGAPITAPTVNTPLRVPGSNRAPELAAAAASTSEIVWTPSRNEPAEERGQAIVLRGQTSPMVLPADLPVETALSSVREVDLEARKADPADAEGVIERAIETLDREARGETLAPISAPAAAETAREAADRMFALPKAGAARPIQDAEIAGPPTDKTSSGSGLSIFLMVFAVLLLGVGGAGFWAWREGYIDFDQMFGQSEAVTETAQIPTATTPTLDPVPSETAPVPEGPGNTATTTDPLPTNTLEGLDTEEDRLVPTPQAATPDAGATVLPDIGATEEPKSEERLPGEDTPVADVNDPAAAVDPEVLAGSQSLLLEASEDGRSGAVPFSGTIDWTEGKDELGLPTIIGNASIPARNLGVEITIRKNTDPSLPASHLMEVNFDVSDSFVGGTIAELKGVLLKDRELVAGAPLVGASARVVGNSFLFALSASATDTTTNTELLKNRGWMDLAIVYGSGRAAIITLEKDDTAKTMFDTVFTAWAQ